MAAPLAWAWGAVSGVRARGARRRRPGGGDGPVVISVGGLEVGGSGKTPVVDYLLGRLAAIGARPGLVSRGYRRRGRGVVVRHRGEPLSPEVLGDEPAMLVAAGHDVPVAVHRRRRLAIAAIAGDADVLVLDDAFSHWGLGRDLDVVVLRGEAPLGRHRALLPWGTLREPVAALARAQILWLAFATAAPARAAAAQLAGTAASVDGLSPMLRRLRAAAPHATWVVSYAAFGRLSSPSGPAGPLVGAKVVGAAGIARPSAFAEQLVRSGADLRAFHAFPDHHRYSPETVAALRASRDAAGAQALVVTAKDYVKIAPMWPDAGLWQQRQQLRLVLGAEAVEVDLARVVSLPAAAGDDV